MEIRKVTFNDDFAAIGSIYAESWKFAYRGIVPQAYLDQLTNRRWMNALNENRYDAFILLDNGQYIGTSSICPARDKDMAGWGEIISLYLLPEYFGKGYAALLLDYVVSALQKEGFQRIYLWALEENARARRFYEKQGFRWNGDTMEAVIGGKSLTEVRYIKKL